ERCCICVTHKCNFASISLIQVISDCNMYLCIYLNQYGNLVNICRKISFWVSGQDDQTPLHISSRLGKQDIVQLLLTNGADPDNGYTPLHIAAKKNQMEISTTLLEYGALTNTVTRQGITPLHLAAQEGSVDIVTLLLARGSPINAGNKVE
uniref:Uncharacterized protein n=1 Tax=Oryzias latipes TaxID=8090 RepID=A0A3B3IIP1_ORYLA